MFNKFFLTAVMHGKCLDQSLTNIKISDWLNNKTDKILET